MCIYKVLKNMLGSPPRKKIKINKDSCDIAAKEQVRWRGKADDELFWSTSSIHVMNSGVYKSLNVGPITGGSRTKCQG
jgi:hypothetical protein